MKKLSLYIVIGVLFISAASFVKAGPTPIRQDEILQNGAGKFKVDIPGLPAASANVHSVQVEDLTIDVRETTTGENWDFRTYAPGDAHFGKATFRFRVGGRSHEELKGWVLDAANGKNIRKDISIIIMSRAGSEGRRYNLQETFPIKYDPGDYSPSSTVRTETLVVKIGRIEFADGGKENGAVNTPVDTQTGLRAAIALSPDDIMITKGFRIEVSDSNGKNEDNAWETATGGALEIEVAPASTGSAQFNVTPPGHTFVEELQLRGPMTKSRTWLTECLAHSLQGKATPFDMTIVELLPGNRVGREHLYQSCIVTRYVFPVLSAEGTGNLYEEVSIKPERLEIK